MSKGQMLFEIYNWVSGIVHIFTAHAHHKNALIWRVAQDSIVWCEVMKQLQLVATKFGNGQARNMENSDLFGMLLC